MDLYRRCWARLLPAFLIFYAADLGARVALANLDGAAVALLIGWRVVVTVIGTFAAAWAALVLAQEVAGAEARRTALRATLVAHSRELLAAGLLASLIVIFFDLLLLGQVFAVALLGPPMVVHAIVLEYRPFREAVARARSLLAGLWARALLVLLAAATAVVAVQVVLALMAGVALQGLEGPALRATAVAFSFLTSSLAAPFVAAAEIVLYLDLRTRTEELDLSGFARERAEAMDERPVGGPIQD